MTSAVVPVFTPTLPFGLCCPLFCRQPVAKQATIYGISAGAAVLYFDADYPTLKTCQNSALI